VGRAGIEPATLGSKVRLNELQRTAPKRKRAANDTTRRCDKLQQNASCGDKPVRPLYAQVVGSKDNAEACAQDEWNGAKVTRRDRSDK